MARSERSESDRRGVISGASLLRYFVEGIIEMDTATGSESGERGAACCLLSEGWCEVVDMIDPSRRKREAEGEAKVITLKVIR